MCRVFRNVIYKFRVTKVTATITKQKDLSEVLTYTAEVEKYENGSWAKTTELSPTQEAQLQWSFIKNNDINDTDILSDNPTDDTVNINGLKMEITVQEDNVHKHGHAHCFVVDADDEGYAVTELVRALEVEDIIPLGSVDEGNAKCEAKVNVEAIKEDEKAKIRWNINGKEKPDFNGKIKISYDLKEENIREIPIKAYINGKPEDAAVIILSNDVESEDTQTNEIDNEEI